MKVLKASEFKAPCLRLMDEVAQSGEPILITKRGKPVSELVPWRPGTRDLFGALRGSIEIQGDIVGPLDVEWEANR